MSKIIDLFAEKVRRNAKEKASFLERFKDQKSSEQVVPEQAKDTVEGVEAPKEEESDLAKTMRENAARKEKQQKERESRNTGVKKSFGIDSKKK